jgi:hypothetical protein
MSLETINRKIIVADNGELFYWCPEQDRYYDELVLRTLHCTECHTPCYWNYAYNYGTVWME